MKKLLKNPALLFAIMLVVSSCGNETKSDDKSDDKYEPKSDARFLVESFEVLESMRDNIRDVDGDDYVENFKTIIKLNEEIIEYNKKLIKTRKSHRSSKNKIKTHIIRNLLEIIPPQQIIMLENLFCLG